MSLLSNQKTLIELGKVNPKLAKHTLIKNDLVRMFALQRFGTIDLLDQPMCTKCERPCTWDKNGTAYHVECGTHIANPVTMLEYLREQIKLPQEILDAFGSVLYDPKEIIIDGGLKSKEE